MTVEDALRELRQTAAALEQDMADEHFRRQLHRSVVRPLDQALAGKAGSAGASTEPGPAPGGDAETGASAADRALELARRATRLRVEHEAGLPLEVVEAVAGLQNLAVALAPDDAAQRRTTFAELQASLPSTIHTEADGPYLVTNPHRLHSWLGVDMPTMPADGPVPLRAVGIQAPLRRHPRRHRLHRRQGPQPGPRPARHVRRPASHRARQPWHLRPLRLLHDRLATVFQREADAFVAPRAAGWTRSSAPSRPAPPGR